MDTDTKAEEETGGTRKGAAEVEGGFDNRGLKIK